MDFKELEYFSTIVKCGNLTHAARQLYVSQPTLSKFLQKLEEDLGLVLFQRGSRRLKLTYAGQRYYAHVERILSQKREMDAEMTDILRSDRVFFMLVSRRSDAASRCRRYYPSSTKSFRRYSSAL